MLRTEQITGDQEPHGHIISLSALRRAQKIRTRLGGSANMMEPFPEKPKGMHYDTYMRLFWKYDEAHREELVRMREWLDKLQKQMG